MNGFTKQESTTSQDAVQPQQGSAPAFDNGGVMQDNVQTQNVYAQPNQNYNGYQNQPIQSQYNQNAFNQIPVAQAVEDKASVGFNILSWFIPLAGLIIYCVNKKEKPVMAKSAGKWALISSIVNIVLSLLISGIMFAAAGSFLGGMMSELDDYDTNISSSESSDVSSDYESDDGTYINDTLKYNGNDVWSTRDNYHITVNNNVIDDISTNHMPE